MFMKLSDIDPFGRPNKYRSLEAAGLLSYGNTANTVALLLGGGDDEATVFANSAKGGNQVWSATSNAQIDIAEKKFGTGSIYCPDSGSFVSSPSHSDYQFGTGDVSIDFWVKRIGNPGFGYYFSFDWDPTFSGLYHLNGGEIIFEIKNGSTLFQMRPGGNRIGTSAFQHIMLTRNGNTWKLWLDGTKIDEGTYSGAFLDFSEPADLGNGMDCWMDGIRINKGVDVSSDPNDPCYSENGSTYTVPTEPYR